MCRRFRPHGPPSGPPPRRTGRPRARSYSEAAPPPTISLIWLAPSLRLFLAATATASGPVGDRRRSDHFGVGRIAALERPGNVIDGPEVAVTARLRNHRAAGEYPGPATIPSSIARFRPKTGPPASRIVVNPRSSVRSASRPAFSCV